MGQPAMGPGEYLCFRMLYILANRSGLLYSMILQYFVLLSPLHTNPCFSHKITASPKGPAISFSTTFTLSEVTPIAKNI
jgi:hypothetical protein